MYSRLYVQLTTQIEIRGVIAHLIIYPPAPKKIPLTLFPVRLPDTTSFEIPEFKI